MINKDTKLYGSFSDKPGNNGCMFFNKGFKKHKIDAIYKSFYSTDIKKTIGSNNIFLYKYILCVFFYYICSRILTVHGP